MIVYFWGALAMPVEVFVAVYFVLLVLGSDIFVLLWENKASSRQVR